MSTVTKATVEATIGEYRYRAELDGNAIELWRDGLYAGAATWNGGKIEGFPASLSEDARDELTRGIESNLGEAWRARVEDDGPATARRGEAEVGKGGPGKDPSTGAIGGQALTPQRGAEGGGAVKDSGGF